MLNFGNKEFRNLQEQVLHNADAIDAIKQGLKIVGVGTEVPSSLEDGEAYLVGTAVPYTLYIKVDGSIINLGQFPKPGPQGGQGPAGSGAVIGTIDTLTTTLEPGMSASVVAETSGNNITFKFEIPQGVPGPTGARGPQGLQGIQGVKGQQGPVGETAYGVEILGVIASADLLPSPSTVARNAGYLVGSSSPYNLYLIIGTNTLSWFNIGSFSPNQIIVDDALSSSSSNPVANSVITNKLNSDSWVQSDNINSDYDYTFDKSIFTSTTWTPGYFVYNDGTLHSAEGSYVSDFILITEEMEANSINYFCNTPYNLFGVIFASDKTTVASVMDGQENPENEYYQPANLSEMKAGRYLRVNANTASYTSGFVFGERVKSSSKQLDWLKIGPTNMITDPIIVSQNISTSTGEMLIGYIPNHMWMKDGTLYASDINFGSTVNIQVSPGEQITIFPLYKYNREGDTDNGAFIGADGKTRVAGLIENSVWDDEHLHMIATVPENAYYLQLNAVTLNNGTKYDTYNANQSVNKSIDISYSANTTITVPWLTLGDIPNGSITTKKLSSTVVDRLVPEYDDTYKYWDILNKPFDFAGKQLWAFGDSITVGVANEGSGNISAGSNSYISLLAAHLGCTLYNRAVSGSTITAGVNTLTPVCDRVDEEIANVPDNGIIIIAGGTNDFNSDATIGSLGDTATKTMYGALDHICNTIKNTKPNATLIFITPINVNTNSFPKKDTSNWIPLNAYRNPIWEVATKYGYNVIDGSTLGFASKIGTPWGALMIHPSDGTHPTLLGHAMYAKALAGRLS